MLREYSLVIRLPLNSSLLPLCGRLLLDYVCIMIKKTPSLLTLFTFLFLTATAFSTPATMRLDYYHTGDAKQELFSIDRVAID